MLLANILKNKLGFKSLPSFCTYIVTWQCNARCEMCNIWHRPKGKELSLDDINNIFSQLKLDAMRITGGEPFLRNDLAEMVNLIQKLSKPKIVHITSNGFLTQKIVNFVTKLNNPQKVHLKISIDAVGKTHDKIRGVDGAFDMAFNTVKELCKIRDKYKFYLGVNQTIVNADGLKEYRALKKICNNLNVKLYSFIAYQPVALYANKPNLNLMPKTSAEFKIYHQFSKPELENLLQTFKNDAKQLNDWKEKIIRKYYLKGAVNRLIKNKAFPNPKCLALKAHLRLLPNGDVPICMFNSNIAGNLKKQSLKELWFGKEIEKYRKLVKNCPGCWLDCEVVPSAIYTGDIIRGLF